MESLTGHMLSPHLSDLLKALMSNSSQEQIFKVTGIITYPSGEPANNVIVVAFDNDLRSKQELGRVQTDAKGAYSIQYKKESFSRAEKDSADLSIQVCSTGRLPEVLYDTPTAEILYNAPAEATISIQLTSPPKGYSDDEYSNLLRIITPLLDGVKISDLKEDEKHSDLTFLTRESGVDRTKLEQLVVAHQLAEKAKIPWPAFFYGIFRANGLTFSDAAEYASQPRVTLHVSPAPVFYSVAIIQTEKLKELLTTAVDQDKLIPESVLGSLQEINKSLSEYTKVAREYWTKEPERENTALERLLGSSALDRLFEFLNKKSFGDFPSVLEDLQTVFQQPAASLVTDFTRSIPGASTDELNNGLLNVTFRQLPDGGSQTLRPHIADLDRSDWKSILKNAPRLFEPLGEEELEIQAAQIVEATEIKFPTRTFLANLRRDASANHALLTVSNILTKVGQENPEFDFATLPLEKLQDLDDNSKINAASTQRLFKLSPKYRHTKQLFDQGFRSATDIQQHGEARFVKLAAKTGVLTETDAKRIYHKAAHIQVTSALLAGELQSVTGAGRLAALGMDAEASKKLEAVTKDFPNMKSLFQLQDICACTECASVHSAAAYVTDTLTWLKNRLVLDPTGSSEHGIKIARDVLFERRGDLEDLDLSCANTNTPIPYIDVVCELLEEAVEPDQGVTFSDSKVSTTEGLATPELLAFLQQQGLEFTADAKVSAVYNKKGYRNVRDVKAVCKMIPDDVDNPQKYQIYVLKPTVGTAEELAAAPSYVNLEAYKALAAASYVFNLPFDLSQSESKAYFDQFGVARNDLMQVLQKVTPPGSPGPNPPPPPVPEDYQIAYTSLNMSDGEYQKIVTEAANDDQLTTFWNYTLEDITVVSTFIDTAAIDYTTLLGLVKLSWLSPDPQKPLTIIHNEPGCDLGTKDIGNLDVAALDRFQRFLRLWKKLSPSWSVEQLHQALQATELGDGKLDKSFIILISQLNTLSKKFPAPLSDVIAFFDTIPPDLYTKLFLNPKENGTVNKDLDPEKVAENEQNERTNPGSGKTLTEYNDYLATSFAMSPADISILISAVDTDKNVLSSKNLARLYLLVRICRILKLKPLELSVMIRLVSLDTTIPFTPQSLLNFLDQCKDALASGATPTSLSYFLDTVDPNIPNNDAVTKIILSLQTEYQAQWEANQSPFQAASTPNENQAAIVALIQKLDSISQSDVDAYKPFLSTGDWSQTEDIEDFITRNLPKGIGDTEIGEIATMADTLSNKSAEDKQPLQNTLLERLSSDLSTYLYHAAKEDILPAGLIAATKGPEDIINVILEKAYLKPPLSPKRRVKEILLDDVLNGAQLPDVTPTNPKLTSHYRTIRLIFVILKFVKYMKIGAADLGWMLDNSGTRIPWLEIDNLKYQDDVANTSFASWRSLYKAIQLSIKYPPVENVSDSSNPFTFFGMITTPTSQRLEYLAQLTGWDLPTLKSLETHYGLDDSLYVKPETYEKLDIALGFIRTLGLDFATTWGLAKAVLVPEDVKTLRQALKSKYSPSDWLGVLKAVQDPLRKRKRDALVAYLLAVNPTMVSSDDLYDYFLIDTQMGSCMQTSRIVQAHATIQLFVQRCLMGLEPKCIADLNEDPLWSQWEWMSAFRVWEANRKIFLWPENWLDPSLRVDKSQLFKDFESYIQQNPLTPVDMETAVSQYLESFDGIANLEVMATYYQVEIYTMHVIARTKGGDPATFYYRQCVKERSWSPWEKIDLDIQSNVILAFDRNSRLNIAWLEFFEEKDPSQMESGVTPPKPSSVEQGSFTTDAPRKRWKIQLAISERVGSSWTTKKVSQGSLASPQYFQSWSLPDKDDYSTVVWDASALGANAGQAITVQIGLGNYIGSFSLVGCKGYPEPISLTPDSLPISFQILPRFRLAQYWANRFQRYSNRGGTGLSIKTWFPSNQGKVGEYEPILENTLEPWKVAYPLQLTIIDWLILIWQFFQRSRYSYVQESFYMAMSNPEYISIQLGAYLPYFFGDYGRSFVIIPGFYPPRPKSATAPYYSAADILKFFQDCLALFFKYAQKLKDDPNRDVKALLEELNKDDEFLRLKELFPIFANTDPGFVRNNKFRVFYHPVVCDIRKALIKGGIDGMMKRELQLTVTDFSFSETYKPTQNVAQTRPVEDVDFSSEGAYSSYNWELFYHIPSLVAQKLSQDGQYEAARKWFHYIFNPTAGSDVSIPRRYWITKPFYRTSIAGYVSQRLDEIFLRIAQDPDASSIPDLKFAVEQWRANVGQPDVVAKTRPVAYQIATVLAYIKNLVDWGDNLFRQFTRETITQATQMYILADKLLGPKPRVVKPEKTPDIATFAELESKIDIFGNSLVDLENLIPDPGDPPTNPGPLPPPPPLRSLYFCIPPNEKMLEYWDLVADRLFKIRNCQNIDGVEVSLALFSPPIDPGALARAVAGGLSISSFLAGLSAPLPYYRFLSMSQKATELAQMTASLGNALLSALEKKDSEALSTLRSGQDIALAKSIKISKQASIDEAVGAVKAAQASKAVTQERRTYFAGRPFMNGPETTAVQLAGVSLGISSAVAAIYILAGGLRLIPDFVAGAAGFGGTPEVSGEIGGSSLGGSVGDAARTLEAIAGAISKSSEMASVQGGYQRRQDDWNHEVASADLELAQWDVQIANAQLHVTTLQRELETQDLTIANNNAIDAYLRTKFSNTDLYNWMSQQIYGTYVTAYKTAFDMAKRAEQCFNFELGQSDKSFFAFSLDTQKKGLLAADNLLAGIKTMEAAYLNQNFREYELSKTISLALLDPESLFQFRNTGKCGITIPETVFDLDHPGHYMRRIKSIALTIPCITGPYTSVSAKLTQVTNRYRATTSTEGGYPENPTANSDTRFRYNLGTIQSIATSTSQSDTGTFELNFRDERYLPFEGTGAISQWVLELPKQVRQFDYSTITDVVITMKYTAREGGGGLRSAVEKLQQDNLNKMKLEAGKTGLWSAFLLPVQFPSEWWQLKKSGANTTTIKIEQRHLPYFTVDQDPEIKSITWFAVPNTLPAGTNPPGNYKLTMGTTELTLAKKDLAQGYGLCYSASVAKPEDDNGGGDDDDESPVPVLGKEFTVKMEKVAEIREIVMLIHYSIVVPPSS
ncbi:hypothetical protein ABW19_dt0208542 [Dactylella cylindrospora]|nr:hypothetical protein ABW19_dt0208542 [Dactylella cylindrospora]